MRKGTAAERFAALCLRDGDHLIWMGGPQFRLGGTGSHRCIPQQAAYLIREGIEQLPPGMAVIRTCARRGCVEHFGLFPESACIRIAQLNHAAPRLSPEQVEWIRSIPNMRDMRMPSRNRPCMMEAILCEVNQVVAPQTIRDMRTPSRRAQDGKRARKR